MNYGNLEKIESVVLSPSYNFNISNVVTLGSANKAGYRKDAMQHHVYKTKKYYDIDTVSSIKVESNDFLVFSYYSDTLKKKEDIFFSYPHIWELNECFNEFYDAYKTDGENIFKVNKNGIYYVSEEYVDWMATCHGINNKTMKFVFDILEKVDENNGTVEYVQGVSFAFNSEDLICTVSMDTFASINYFLNKFNLLLSSQNLAILAYTSELSKGLAVENKASRDVSKGSLNQRRIVGKKKDKEETAVETETKKPVIKRKSIKSNSYQGEINEIIDNGEEELPFEHFVND